MIGFGICDKCKRYGTVKENIVVNGNEIRVFLLCNECEEKKGGVKYEISNRKFSEWKS
ncbi:hypothetical protein LI064_01805 [Clostridium perfringens]|uniref:hypothetical protein n=1 Tax=Clostridium perfringens TaxID=1502 RepID=UPI002246CADA|nr:hypothetical protein [Clostridium perfringens]MCX0353257.1 hypothetical protein [Clostridium perfringens]